MVPELPGAAFDRDKALGWCVACLAVCSAIGAMIAMIGEPLNLIAMAAMSSMFLGIMVWGPGLALLIALFGKSAALTRSPAMFAAWVIAGATFSLPAAWVTGFAFGGGVEMALLTVTAGSLGAGAAFAGGRRVRSGS